MQTLAREGPKWRCGRGGERAAAAVFNDYGRIGYAPTVRAAASLQPRSLRTSEGVTCPVVLSGLSNSYRCRSGLLKIERGVRSSCWPWASTLENALRKSSIVWNVAEHFSFVAGPKTMVGGAFWTLAVGRT